MSQQQLQTIVQMLRAQPAVKPDASVQEARGAFEEIASMFPVDADIKTRGRRRGWCQGRMGERAGCGGGRAILYLHGGGYVIGSINYASFSRREAGAGVQGASARHRLSPRPQSTRIRPRSTTRSPPTAGCSAKG